MQPAVEGMAKARRGRDRRYILEEHLERRREAVVPVRDLPKPNADRAEGACFARGTLSTLCERHLRAAEREIRALLLKHPSKQTDIQTDGLRRKRAV